jgi:hypothetical protein
MALGEPREVSARHQPQRNPIRSKERFIVRQLLPLLVGEGECLEGVSFHVKHLAVKDRVASAPNFAED